MNARQDRHCQDAAGCGIQYVIRICGKCRIIFIVRNLPTVKCGFPGLICRIADSILYMYANCGRGAGRGAVTPARGVVARVLEECKPSREGSSPRRKKGHPFLDSIYIYRYHKAKFELLILLIVKIY